MAMVVIDERDIGKTREDLLRDLLYESTGRRIPADKIVYGKPVTMDARPDDMLDPNTFMPVRVNVNYDNRFKNNGDGFMYRRRDLAKHGRDCNFGSVLPEYLPFKVSDILDQINSCMPYPIAASDIIDYEYETLEQVQDGIKLQAHPESYLWVSGKTFKIDDTLIRYQSPIKTRRLLGFFVYRG